ncbi:chemotaxis protein CheW [Rhodovibrio salinarum]|uniref:Chemotaxis protein CheA n=1 Tax=Rhodovibrio salinarum TaxID=1087 RepID=A0A934QIJ8_9PROT|nr:chemotaxis protein CheW [Rhodovibrio salinarum]MBK1697688.1 hybrid sensor histidine kinase/response regulator [Rhodovibrio salinarum]
MDDLLGEFLTETNEGLQVLDTELVKLEQDPSPELLDNIFRVMHTIKGTCGFLGLPRLEAVAHSGETVLGKIRDGELVVTASRVSLILECLDRIREILSALEETESEPEGDDSALIAKLDAVSEMADYPDAPVPEDSGDQGSGEGAATSEPETQSEPVDELEEIFRNAPGPEDLPESAQLKDTGPPAADASADQAETPAPEAAQDTASEQPAAKAEASKAESKSEAPAAKKADKPAGKPPEREAPRESQVASQSIRVSVDLLENLMTTVSELVLNRNQLLQILRSQQESEFSAPLQRLNHVVSELQEGVMKTRMQPIGNAWSKLPRIVRDLAQELDKKIELKMKGEDTELDRQVLELIKDPLTHMVRNSADHGIETTVDRAKSGKAEVGTIALNAYHEGGHIIIEIGDDGRGLNVDKIKAKALKNQITTEAEVAQLTEQQIQQFIFKPGFSTADAVTAVSGRGVGMDVVRTNIEKIGGTIELSSKEGMGSKFTVKIPLTLAIVSALIVECTGERFAIPQLSVLELVRAKGGSENQIERIKDTPVLRLRDRLLPLVNLRELLKLQGHGNNAGGENPAERTEADTDGFIVVAQVGTYSFGIIVDRVFDTEEIVVKPVARILRDIPLFSGNTILGDGRVVMILDPNGIASASGELTLVEGDDALEDTRKQRSDSEEEVSMLVFNAAGKSPKAVPLALVARLEEIPTDTIEDSNGQRVVQYRGQLMPLITMPGGEIAESGNQPVLVFTDRDRSMGLVVDEIVDIVEERMHIELHGERPGYLGSAVIAGKATDIVDAGYFLTQAFSDWFEAESVRDAREGNGKRVLLVDDSPFFRNLLAPLLDVAGYDVTTADCADTALEMCNSGHEFDVIVSDIEMPGMNGYEFAATLREQGKWADTPLVALSSHAAPSDLERGRQAGFRDYVAKFDRETLLDSLNQTLGQDQEPLRGAA